MMPDSSAYLVPEILKHGLVESCFHFFFAVENRAAHAVHDMAEKDMSLFDFKKTVGLHASVAPLYMQRRQYVPLS